MQQRDGFKISVISDKMENVCRKALVVGVFQDAPVSDNIRKFVDQYSHVKLSELIRSGEIKGEFKEFTIVHLGPDKPFEKVICMGLGKQADFQIDVVRSIVAKAARTLRKVRCSEMVIMPELFPTYDPEAFAREVTIGVILGIYHVKKYVKTETQKQTFDHLYFLIPPETDKAPYERGLAEGDTLAWATNMVRDLGNEPGCFMTPRKLAEKAEQLGKEFHFQVEVMDEKQIEKVGFNGLTAVAQGSHEPPRFIVMRYNGGDDKAPTLALVGKGVTFDSGGISLKSREGMGQMKYDMSGAAAVMGVLQTAAYRKLKNVNLIGIIPSCENIPGPKAYKPGDVIKMYNGKYVEVTDTDAEGRMILADALAYSTYLGADMVIDLATLTGGVVVALGHIASGIMGNNPWIIRELIDSGKETEEKLWELPLFDEYKIQMGSAVANIINASGRAASAITGGIFLKEFVDIPWAHLDIAGTAWIDEDKMLYYHKPYLPKRGATGVGVRTLYMFAKKISHLCHGRKEELLNLMKSK